MCGAKCRLAATLKIVNGTEWRPELANRDTLEWQELANTIEIEVRNNSLTFEKFDSKLFSLTHNKLIDNTTIHILKPNTRNLIVVIRIYLVSSYSNYLVD